MQQLWNIVAQLNYDHESDPIGYKIGKTLGENQLQSQFALQNCQKRKFNRYEFMQPQLLFLCVKSAESLRHLEESRRANRPSPFQLPCYRLHLQCY